MYGLFNLILFPLYYRTADRYGIPVILSVGAAVLFAAAMEVLASTNLSFQRFLEHRQDVQILLPITGFFLFAGASYLAYRLSARSFERVEL